jgi:hypothetical protein
MIISIIVSEILRMALSILSSAYLYLIELLLILIILPIILLIATFSPSLPNDTKKFILYLNMFYSLLLLYIPKLLLIILNYGRILNNIYITSHFPIFGLILTEIYRNIGLFAKMYIIFINIYVIIIIISFIMIILYVFREIHNYEFKTPDFKKYINNKKIFFIVILFTSLISGAFLFFFILPTHSGLYIDRFFLSILLIATILYVLLSNQKNRIKILSKSLKHAMDMATLLSSILSLSFSKVEESIANIFALHSTAYSLVTYIIIVITIFLLIFIMILYIHILNINRNLENIVKWIILMGFSISLLAVYLFGAGSILYIIMGLLIFIILIYVYLYVYSCILNNIDKKNWNDILSIILLAYIILSTILYPVVGVLYLAIIYVSLAIISLFIYCIVLKLIRKKIIINNNLM